MFVCVGECFCRCVDVWAGCYYVDVLYCVNVYVTVCMCVCVLCFYEYMCVLTC